MNLPRSFCLLVIAAIAFSAGRAAENPAPVLRPFALMGNPPPVQMTVPGFVVRELPVRLTNINNLAYAPDGRLFAYAYDGNVYQLHDTDGDGLEDKATHFYKNEHEVVGSVGFRWGPDGLYLASRQRIIRLRDRGDGTATLETVVSGWTPPDKIGGHYLDVYGIAFDRAGNLYFGLGTDDIRNAYRVNPDTDVSAWTRQHDRGTVQRVTPEGKREIYATGVRYSVGLAVNAAGDLFATDQEGATWLPNGNPLDELLHIQRDRHYGFPPRHPKYAPDLIDEPSVFDYGPQHQSICGLNFNDPHREGASIFGPAWWQGDALAAGEARGRIWRTKLVKTEVGYVARNETIAHLSMLTIDVVPSPQGDLLVACHSGRPDWGTGPTGEGKLYKISYRDRSAPQPVFAYAANPTETRIVFDRALTPEQAKHFSAAPVVTMGEYVSSGDRFESFRPGYQAVKDQQKAPRYQLPVIATELSADKRSLIVRTSPRAAAVSYSLGLREQAAAERPFDSAKHELRQQAAIDIGADLSGADARWQSAAGAEQWSGWLPHLDLTVARAFTAPSAEHAKLFEQLRQPGTLELKAQLNLYSMLHPAVQPGSTLDYEYPPETVHVRLKASGKLALDVRSPAAQTRRVSETEWEITLPRSTSNWLPVALELETGASEPRLDVSWWTAEDKRPRALPLHRVLMPWAERQEAHTTISTERDIPEIAGGDWERGRQLFFGAATCGVCHQVAGKGGTVGPDLTNLVHRDYASVMQDINEPNAAINPDYLTFTVQLNNGETSSGAVISNNSERVVLGLVSGETKTFPKAEVVSLKPLGVSIMPPALLNTLTKQQQNDVLTFLLKPKTTDTASR